MPVISPLPCPPTRTDATSVGTMSLPAANSNATGAAIDLAKTGYGLWDDVSMFETRLSIPATPSLANGQTLTVQLQDSPDGVTYSPIVTEPVTVIIGAGGAGGPATAVTYRIARDARLYVQRRFLALNIAASATAGNNTAVSATLQLFS